MIDRICSRRWLAAGLVVAAFGCCAASAQAVPADEEPGVIRLSPAERSAVLDSTAAENADLTGGNFGRQVHGEIGAMIGTGGTRGIYGTAAVPLGDTGMAIFSFENSRYGRLR